MSKLFSHFHNNLGVPTSFFVYSVFQSVKVSPGCVKWCSTIRSHSCANNYCSDAIAVV